jgi:transcriptional regulator with XRE-family HTH domain
MELHESMRAARSRAGHTGTKMAELLGMGGAAYLRYERGEVSPAASLILKMAEELKCSPTALMLNGGVELAGDHPPRAMAKSGETLDVALGAGETVKIEINIHARPNDHNIT